MDTHRTAQFIATLILAANTRATKAARTKEQNRLWALAAKKRVLADVVRLVVTEAA